MTRSRAKATLITSKGEHHDPAIGAFLGLLEADTREGRNVGSLPVELATTMLANAKTDTDPDELIEGEVAL